MNFVAAVLKVVRTNGLTEDEDNSLVVVLDQSDGRIVKTFRVIGLAPTQDELVFLSTGPNVQQINNYFIAHGVNGNIASSSSRFTLLGYDLQTSEKLQTQHSYDFFGVRTVSSLRNLAVFGGASRRVDNDASRFSPLIVFTNSQLVPTRAFRLVTPETDTASYSVDYLYENTDTDRIVGVSVPRDS